MKGTQTLTEKNVHGVITPLKHSQFYRTDNLRYVLNEDCRGMLVQIRTGVIRASRRKEATKHDFVVTNCIISTLSYLINTGRGTGISPGQKTPLAAGFSSASV